MAAAKIDEAFVAADIAFHQAIYFATRNEFFWPIAQMFDIALRQSFTIAARGSHRARALVEHHAVLDAIATGNVEGARAATNVLLNNSADDLVRIRGREFAARPKAPATPARERS
jgi:DNA-binding FadR family transcriptional regulator